MKRVLGIALSMLLAFASQAESELEVESPQLTALGVKLAAPQLINSTLGARLPGQVVIPPAQIRIVSATQAGLLQSLLVAEGESVSKGQLMAELQSQELIALQRDYLQTVTQMQLALTDMRRDQQLFKEGVIAKRRLLEKQSRYSELEAAEDERRRALMLAGMQDDEIDALKENRKLSSKMSIRAPDDAVVLKQLLTPGEQLDRMTPIYRLATMQPLWLEIRLPLAQLKGVELGTAVQVVEPAVSGKLILIGREVNPANQTVLLRVEVAEGADQLRPGQFVEARLASAVDSQQFEIPSSAISRSDNQTYLFVRSAKGFAVQPVTVVGQQGDRAVVSADLQPKDQVAVSGVSALKAIWLGLGGGE